ncbi:MAG TPA: hypothetical protein VG206_23000 [Terriglobia bacterium]|nr:hypothetical protein [Terriglobia bacterium]
MDLLILGAGMGLVGGLLPNPLQMIALAEAALGRWGRAIFVLTVPPLVVDNAFLFMTLLFFRLIPLEVVRYIACAGGLLVTGFAIRGLWELRRRRQEKLPNPSGYTLASVSVATLAEVTAPGTWIYWLTIAGPILAEGRTNGYGHVVPFFVGGLLGYYGGAVGSTCFMAWVAGLREAFRRYLLLTANILLLLIGISYLIRAYLA